MDVEDGEIEDAKMADSQQTRDADAPTSSNLEPTSENTSGAFDGNADVPAADRPSSARSQDPPTRPRPGSRTRDSGRLNDIPKRPEERPNPRAQANRPRLSEGNRLPPRPDLLDRPDFNPRTRHSNLDHSRSFEGPMPGEPRGRGRMNDREREFPMRPLPDEMRGPYHENRTPRDQDWQMDRPGRNRPSEPFHGRDGPARGELMPDFPDRPADGPRRGEPMRPEKDDRRNYPRALSPSRSELPNRPERFPNERRGANQTQPRSDEFPRGPRNPGGDSRDSVAAPDMDHGRLRPPETTPDIPSGPRNRNNNRSSRNVSGAPVAPGSSNATKLPSPDRQMPSGPNRKGGRGARDSSPAAQPSGGGESTGIHPDRLRHIITDSPSQSQPSTAMTPPSGPRSGTGNQQTPRGSRGERNRGGGNGGGNGGGPGDKRFSGIADMLQQNKPDSPTAATPPGRGRGSNRQSLNAPDASPQAFNRPPTGPSASQDDSQTRNRGNARGGDLLEDAGSNDNRRGGRDNDRDRERRADDSTNGGSSNRREDRRERDRSRRSDVGGSGGPRDEKDRSRHNESRESHRRNAGSREEMRRRDRRDRDDGPSEAGTATPTAVQSENENRNRPSSSMGAPPPPPPPPNPPPLPNDESGRRWNPSGDRNNRPENRDRERERRGDRGRDRDHHRDGNRHRKRGPPNQDDNAGADGTPRGQRMGGDSKRPRRGQ